MLVLIPLGGLVLKTKSMGWIAVRCRGHHAGISLLSIEPWSFPGGRVGERRVRFLVAWSSVRYAFPGKRLIEAIVDLPFALPTAVSGIALSAPYSRSGWIGRLLPAGVEVSYTCLGVVDRTHVYWPAVRSSHPPTGVGRP